MCTYVSNAGNASERRSRMQNFCLILDKLCNTTSPIVILGDFNAPDIQWLDLSISDSVTMEVTLVNSCVNNGLHQLVSGITRPYKPGDGNDEGAIICSSDAFNSNGNASCGNRGTIIYLLLTSEPSIIEDLSVLTPPVPSDYKALSFTLHYDRACMLQLLAG